MWDKVKQYWVQLLEIMAAVIGFIFLRQEAQAGLKARLKNADTDIQSKVLDEKAAEVNKDLAQEQVTQNDLRFKLDQPVSENEQDALNYWNKK